MNWILGLSLLALIAYVSHRAGRFFKSPTITAGAYVIDGDSLTMDGHEIRLFGMDAPEMGQSQGPAARRALQGLVRGRQLTAHIIETDRYGRLVARVIRDDGVDLSQIMVAEGFARASSRYTRAYTRDQRLAEETRAGFWSHGGVQDGAIYRMAQRG